MLIFCPKQVTSLSASFSVNMKNDDLGVVISLSQLRTTSTAASHPCLSPFWEAFFLALALKSDRKPIPPGKHTLGSNTWVNKTYRSFFVWMTGLVI